MFGQQPSAPGNLRVCNTDDTSCEGPAGASIWVKHFGGTSSDKGQALAIDAARDMLMIGSFIGTANFGSSPLVSAGATDILIAKYSNVGLPLWSNRIGSVGLDQGAGVAIDRSVNCDGAGGTNCIVVAGNFSGTVDLDPGPGTANLTSAGGGDCFVAKYSSSGDYLWARRFGGANSSFPDYVYGVAVDSSLNCDGSGGSGCILFTGSYYQSADFDGVSVTGQAGVNNPYVAKYSAGGSQLWIKSFSNTNEGFGRAIAVDAAGDVAIAGSFKGSFNLGNGTKSSFGGDDAFVAKLRGTDGAGIWSSRYGSGGEELGNGVAFDKSGDVVVVGTFTSTSGGMTFGGDIWSANGKDIFVAKLDGTNAGSHVWSRRCSGSYTAIRQISAVAVDKDNNILITGHFNGSLNCGLDTQTLTGAGSADIFVAKFSSSGGPVWMRGYGALGAGNSANSVATDLENGDCAVTGYFQGNLNVEGETLTSTGSDDVFLLRLGP